MKPPLFPALKAAHRLPSPPAVALRILQLVDREDTTLDELARVISADPALTARILRYVRSPLLGHGFEGTTLAEAIARIGTRGAQLLALSFSLVSQRQLQACPSFDFDGFWSESLARAVAARRLAALHRRRDPEEAFIAGLVLRIGQLVLATAQPAEYEPVLRGGPDQPDALEARERWAFGTDHLELGAQLLREWKLPDSIRAALEPAADPGGDGDSVLPAAEAIGAFLSHPPGERAARFDALLVQVATFTGLDRPAVGRLLDGIGQDWSAYGDLLAVRTSALPDLEALESEAEEHRHALQLAAELEVLSLRQENRQLNELASRDRLTGLSNRGAFDDALAARCAAAAESAGSLAVLMIDLDRFKLVNDTHGHPVGDAVLRHVAGLIGAYARRPAEAFRYGGEEFAVVLPGGTQADAITLAEAIRHAVEHSPCVVDARTVPVTLSVGVAWVQCLRQAIPPAALISAADQRLYLAKQSGRNCCRC